jgi:hypothetical protein
MIPFSGSAVDNDAGAHDRREDKRTHASLKPPVMPVARKAQRTKRYGTR